MLNDIEKRIISAIQGDIDIVARPYEGIARDLGISETDLLEALRDLCDRGVIRRFGATLRHQKSGFSANAMVAWQVDTDRVEVVGPVMAAFDTVTHCYCRPPAKDWPYNLYTMIHAASEAACHTMAAEMSRKTGISDYTLLFSRKELKKTSMAYFDDDDQ
ncbi:MAG: Lrp/AsnC family transcriptional regulator [Pseudomonadota bacterium]